MEDDIFIRDPLVFDSYIHVARETGIQHLNFSQHGINNKNTQGKADPITSVTYAHAHINLYRHCVGAFSYLTRKCLDEVGLLDENYFNALEHVEHTYRIIKAGMHPPFWFFADLDHSQRHFGEDLWTPNQSIITSRGNSLDLLKKSDALFCSKHGCLVGEIPVAGKAAVMKSLKSIQRQFGGGSMMPPQAIGTWMGHSPWLNPWAKLKNRFLGIS
jgi:GT2 family glycosyltransferase